MTRKEKNTDRHPQEHWDIVYGKQPVETSSWFQLEPKVSLRMIGNAGINRDQPIIDVGGGASRLAGYLLREGYEDITVLDVSAAGLRQSRERLEDPVVGVKWIESDILHFEPERTYALWHDRALFHFMTLQQQRTAYLEVMKKALAPGSQAIIATFSMEGPETCSGLPVRRYDADRLLAEFGDAFSLETTERESHLTPGGELQAFAYFRIRRR